MRLKEKEIGVALPGNHEQTDSVLLEMEKLKAEGATLTPLLYGSYSQDLEKKLTRLTEKTLQEIDLQTSVKVDFPFDLLVFAPCPVNAVEMLLDVNQTPCITSRATTHLQASQPVVIALASNGHSAKLLKSVQVLMLLRDIYLVPFTARLDNSSSVLITRVELLTETCVRAIARKQLQPVFLEQYVFPQ